MKNQQRGSMVITTLIIIAAILVGVASYIYLERSVESNPVPNASPVANNQVENAQSLSKINPDNATGKSVSFVVSGNSLSLIYEGKDIQTISLSQDAIEGLEAVPVNIDRFITNLDVDFDGQDDVGVFTSTGYAGVDNYYDFYIYNPQSKRLEKSPVLVEISNPSVDIDKRQVKSNYRSGPQWYNDTFQFNGTTYNKSSGQR